MCPLRLILIFLSATLAGFFVIRNLKSPQQQLSDDVLLDADDSTDTTKNQSPCSKVSDIFWDFVYLLGFLFLGC